MCGVAWAGLKASQSTALGQTCTELGGGVAGGGPAGEGEMCDWSHQIHPDRGLGVVLDLKPPTPLSPTPAPPHNPQARHHNHYHHTSSALCCTPSAHLDSAAVAGPRPDKVGRGGGRHGNGEVRGAVDCSDGGPHAAALQAASAARA